MNFVSAIQALAAPHQDLLLAVFLVSLRLAPTMLFTPLLQAFSVPPTVRVLLVVGLASGLAFGIDEARLPSAATLGTASLISAACTELVLGATLALGLAAVFGAVVMAGRLIDVQAGFGLAQVFDPTTRRQVPILHAAFEKLGVLVFFLLNGHHALLRAMAYSLDRFPLGHPGRSRRPPPGSSRR